MSRRCRDTSPRARGTLQLATRDTYVPPNALVITGQFIDIDEGNRLRRLVIGFGAGQSKLDAQVQVLQSSSSGYRKLLEFTTHADSGQMPGERR